MEPPVRGQKFVPADEKGVCGLDAEFVQEPKRGVYPGKGFLSAFRLENNCNHTHQLNRFGVKKDLAPRQGKRKQIRCIRL